MTVAALYVDLGGPYPHIFDVQCYGLPWRDARRYEGPWPVVAHPPCGPWSRLSHQYQAGGKDLALRAVEQVRAFGGVLEHPALSRLWEAANLPPVHGPPRDFDDPGYSIEVEQCAWGHVARKRTWLYLVGVPRLRVLETLRTGGEPTHWCSGSRGETSRTGNPVPPGIKVCSAEQRRRTPPDFAKWLVSLARAAHVSPARAASLYPLEQAAISLPGVQS
jgi:hypothetical protein